MSRFNESLFLSKMPEEFRSLYLGYERGTDKTYITFSCKTCSSSVRTSLFALTSGRHWNCASCQAIIRNRSRSADTVPEEFKSYFIRTSYVPDSSPSHRVRGDLNVKRYYFNCSSCGKEFSCSSSTVQRMTLCMCKTCKNHTIKVKENSYDLLPEVVKPCFVSEDYSRGKLSFWLKCSSCGSLYFLDKRQLQRRKYPNLCNSCSRSVYGLVLSTDTSFKRSSINAKFFFNARAGRIYYRSVSGIADCHHIFPVSKCRYTNNSSLAVAYENSIFLLHADHMAVHYQKPAKTSGYDYLFSELRRICSARNCSLAELKALHSLIEDYEKNVVFNL